MSMTREETIKILNDEEIASLVGKFHGGKEALDLAISALRPVGRERVEKVWRGEWKPTEYPFMNECEDCSVCGYRMVWGHGFDFCPVCGAAQTDKAVDIIVERLEDLYGQASD